MLLRRLVELAGGVPSVGWSVAFVSTPKWCGHGHCENCYREVLCSIAYTHPVIGDRIDYLDSALAIYRLIRHEIYHVNDRQGAQFKDRDGKRIPYDVRPHEIRARMAECAPLTRDEEDAVIDLAEAIQTWKNKKKPQRPVTVSGASVASFPTQVRQ